MSSTPRLTRTPGEVTVAADTYSLSWRSGPDGVVRSPYLHLRDAAGKRWARLSILSSADTVDMHDETMSIAEPEARHEGADIVVTVETQSPAWRRRSLEVRCTPDGIELTVIAEGTADLDSVSFFGGDGILPTGASGTFRSSLKARSMYVPAPTEPIAFVRPPSAAARLGVVGDAAPGRLHGIFSPPPLMMAFGRAEPTGPVDPPEGDWLAVSVRAPVSELTFTALSYEPVDGGFLIRLGYEGHTHVDGVWRSPTFVVRPVGSAFDSLTIHRDDLVTAGFATDAAHPVQPWWLQPLFCGWGEQVARGRASASEFCRQELYDEFLTVMHDADLDPGTIIIDDRWQESYGSAEPDRAAWPDLAGWIAARHEEGRRVLLWFKAWDPAGLPVEECVTDAAGRPVAADPGSKAYLARLDGIVAALLSPDGLDADGLKVDFTQRAPSGRTLRSAPDSDGVWGIAALHRLLARIHTAAKRAKPDALVVTHTVHPSFGDVSDMIRTNDVLKEDVSGTAVPVTDQLRARHTIVARTLPHHPIDTDQWPMPDRSEWLAYARLQPELGVPALYYLERVRAGVPIEDGDLAEIRDGWATYRASLT